MESVHYFEFEVYKKTERQYAIRVATLEPVGIDDEDGQPIYKAIPNGAISMPPDVWKDFKKILNSHPQVVRIIED